jgi:hypothetical protein
VERSGIATVTTLRHGSSQLSDGDVRWHLPLASPRLPRRLRFNRVSVGETFDGFGLRWDMGQLELALTDEGVGARWEF